MPGPRRKSRAAEDVGTTKRAKRGEAPGFEVAGDELLTEPDTLWDQSARAFWSTHAKRMRDAGLLTEADIETFTDLCNRYAFMLSAKRHLQAHVKRAEDLGINPFIQETEGMDRQHPMAKAYQEASNIFDRLASKFGMNPQARSTVEVTNTKGSELDPFAQVLKQFDGQ